MDKRLCIATATPSRAKYILKSSCLNWCGLFLWVIIMTIQSVNLTVPGGDTPRSAFTKINANFSDQNNAASRLVGSTANDISTNSSALKNAIKYDFCDRATSTYKNDVNNHVAGDRVYANTASVTNLPAGFTAGIITTHNLLGGTLYQFAVAALISSANYGQMWFRHYYNNGWGDWIKHLTSTNTTVDGNGFIKSSSPVLRVFSNRIEGNADGDVMSATYTKNGVGDYTIRGTTGLRTDGWYIVIPNDMNGNPKVAVTLDDTDGVITLRSYVRIFDMTTFKFVPDLNQPLDIPDGRWIDLRLNDLPIAESADMPAQQPNN